MSRDKDNLTSMCYWWPLVQGLGVPLPRTQLFDVGVAEVHAWFMSILEVLEDGKSANELPPNPEWLKDLQHMADSFGYPLFLRTDLFSGKHDWKNACHVPNAKALPGHAFGILYECECQTMIGLPNRAWAVRELLEPVPGFTFFGDLPIGRERRYFVRDGQVQCHHPYWPEEAFARFGEPMDQTLRKTLVALSDETDDVVLLTDYAGRLAQVLEGYWSVDFYCDASGKWWFIDAAVGDASWHPDCPFAKEG